jgi:adenosylmethionine-8-amino-7-oxononanoate aminotransferase
MSASEAERLLRDAEAHCLMPMVARGGDEREPPTVYVRGQGLELEDVHGRVFLDMMGSHTRANSLGYGNREIARAVAAQLSTLHYVGTASHLAPPTIELATTLARLAPGRLDRAMFVSGGSEAVECALKLARQHQQASGRKPHAYKTISRWTAYHGATMGALSVTDWLPVHEVPDARVPGHSFIPNPTSWRNPFGMGDEAYADHCATALEAQIELEGPELVAAFIGEPIMQAHGVQIPPRRYWQRVREICDRHGVLLIADEVITGFGRTGAWFACEHFGLEPDIMTMAKALTAGYAPMGAVITRGEIADAIPMFRHVHTFSGHAACAAAANAAIGIVERDGLVLRARQNGEYLRQALEEALGRHPIVGQVRGIGHWHAVELTADRATRAPFEDDTVAAVVRHMRDESRVLACTIGHAFEMAPALTATREQLDRAVEAAARAVHEVARARGLGERA